MNINEKGSISIGVDQTSRKAISNMNMIPIYKSKQPEQQD